MAMHAPATIPHGVHVWRELLAVLLIGAALIAALIVGSQLIKPTTTTQTGQGTSTTWMTEQRHGEIDAGRSGGPHSDYLQYRAGEYNP